MDLGGRGGDDGQETVTALYDYTKDDEDELSFLEGDEIVKLSEPTDEGAFTHCLTLLTFDQAGAKDDSSKMAKLASSPFNMLTWAKRKRERKALHLGYL